MRRRLPIVFTLLFVSVGLYAQTAGVSKPITVNIVREVLPAILDIVPGSVAFADSDGNEAIDAGETCLVRFQVRNSGKGDGTGCRVKASVTGTSAGITVKEMTLPAIGPGEILPVELTVKAGPKTSRGQVTIRIEVTEANGFGTDPVELTVATSEFVSPMLKIVDYSVTSSSGGTSLQKKVPFDLQLMLQNTDYGRAENVNVRLVLPDGVFLMDGKELTNFAALEGGASQSIVYQLIVTNNYTDQNIPLKILLSEKYGKYAEDRTIGLQINQSLSANKLSVGSGEVRREEIVVAKIGSEVDRDIPVNPQDNEGTFVLIVANEKYQTVAPVPFARNDGAVFREYCTNTLGIPQNNVRLLQDATLNQIRSGLNWLRNITDVTDTPRIIFYYAGHGVPDESSRNSYILPVDGIGNDVTTGFGIDDLYAALGGMSAERVTVFMDACFSGSRREDGMIASARGIALKSKPGQPVGNMVVFSAAQGDETAYPDPDQGHGMFTYYLLKKLRETGGEADLQSLGDYIITNVTRRSVTLNGKRQTPCVVPSSAVGESWKDWTLKLK
ncbi:MAG: caspase family protein [Candidatus Cryptobacteroides sp.]